MKILFILFMGVLLAGGMTSSCKHYATEPQDSVKCDTCGIDTTHPPCDTCNLNRDSLSHAFEWTEYTISGERDITGVAVFGENNIYAFSSKLYAFDGTTWTETKTTINNHTYIPLFTDMFVFGIASQEYWCASGTIVYHGKVDKIDEFRLNQIGIYDLSTDGPIRACWGSSNNDMFFVGDLGTIFHYDGSNWNKFPKITNKNLRSVWGTSHNNVWATGYNSSTDESILLHYDGSSWTEDEFSTSGQTVQYGIGNVWATDSAGHRLAVISGTFIFRKTDNGPWRKDTSDLHNGLGGKNYVGIAAYGGTPDDILAAGGWGYISHWNGKTWHRYDSLFDYSNGVYGAAGLSIKGNTACVVGIKNGQSWVAVGKRKP